MQYVYGYITVRLGDIIEAQRGVRVVRSQLSDDGQYNVFQNSLKPLGKYEKYNCRGDMTYVISAGAAGEIGFSDEPFWAADDCVYLDCPSDIIVDRYLYFVLLSKQQSLLSCVRRASIPRLSRDSISNLIISIPSLDKQCQVVDILNRFDKIINDMSDGIPAEIEARQNQYEYYRDKLLTFKKLS